MVAGVGRLSGMCCAESLQTWSPGHSCAGAAALSHRHSLSLHAALGCWRCSPPHSASTLPLLAATKHSYRCAFLLALLQHQQQSLPGSSAQPPLCPVCRWLLVVIHSAMSDAVFTLADPGGCFLYTGCLTNISRVSGLPLTVLKYGGEEHSSSICPISEALLFKYNYFLYDNTD